MRAFGPAPDKIDTGHVRCTLIIGKSLRDFFYGVRAPHDVRRDDITVNAEVAGDLDDRTKILTLGARMGPARLELTWGFGLGVRT